MSIIQDLITDRTSSDVSRWSELKSKGWSGMTESEKAEWSAGMKGAYKYTDLNRVNEAMVYLQNRLRGYGYLVDVVLPVIEEVEEGTSRLPTGYQEVEYIQSSGTQYVDTGFKPNQDTRVMMDFELLSVIGQYADPIFGVRTSASAAGYYFWASGTAVATERYQSGYNNSSTYPAVTRVGRHTVDKNKNVTTVDGVTTEAAYAAFTTAWNMLLFQSYNNGNLYSQTTHMRLYSCQIYDNGQLIRNFVSCKNPSGAAGLYDLENDQFYGNAGTGSFSVGPDVGTPPVITTRSYWKEGDIPTEAQMDQYLQNVSNIRAVLEVLQTTPPVPSDMVGLTFEEANDIEHILVDIETVINRVVAGFFRTNAFTVICGNRPLPSAQSDLGRTWDDIDAEALTWDDLDDHGSSWYVIQYGVLKGAAVGIL